MPDDPGLSAHLKRTVALALQIGTELRIPEQLAPVLERAAWLHHLPLATVRGAGLSETEVLCDVRQVLLHFHGATALEAGPAHLTISGIVRTADLFDQKLESYSAGSETFEGILRDLWELSNCGQGSPEAVAALQVWSADILSDFGDLAGRLAVNPASAKQVRRLLTMEANCDPGRLESIACKDPVLAASVIRVANSPLFSPVMPIGRLGVAVSFIGARNTRNAMIAAVLRPLCLSAGLQRLWAHSIEMARFAEALAAKTGIIDGEEAFLLGLMHDIGRLAIQHFPKVLVERKTRLSELGCPDTHAELCVFRSEHGQIGEAVLKAWGFPETFTAAVRDHHRPEHSDSALAAFLYLGEVGLGSVEDIPSEPRLRACSERTGITPDMLAAVTVTGKSLGALLAEQA